MRVRSVRPSQPSPKDQDLDKGRWGTWQVFVFCSILALVSVPTSVVIGSSLGGADGILMALAISVAFVPLFGSIALALVALGSVADSMRGWVARHGRRSWGGVGDEWLDGPR